MATRCRILLLTFLLLTTAALADDLTRVMEEAQKSSPLESNLRVLTDEIGGRVPGTAAMLRAIEWGVARFKGARADEVHTESFKMPVFW